jgi:predicted enzyme related to lactoylglutathione lyase
MSRIVHIALKVDDLEHAAQFYERVFGFTEVKTEQVRDHTSRHLSDGAIDLSLLKYDAGTASAESRAAGEGPCIHHFAVEVHDLDSTERQIRAFGCEIISDPGVLPVKFRVPGGTVCEIVSRGRYRPPRRGWSAARAGTKRPREASRRRGELWSGIALAALGAYVIAQARQWDYLTPDGPGAGFFPLWYGVAMVALSGFLVVSNLRRTPAAGQRLDRSRLGRALTTWLALAVSVAAFKLLGFVASFALLTFFLVAVMFRRPLKVAALVAVASALGFYLVFPLALGVELPVGVLGF